MRTLTKSWPTALVALAMSAVLVAAAHANPKGQFTAGETPNKHTTSLVEGKEYGSQETYVEFGENKLICEGAEGGFKINSTITNGTAKTLTVTWAPAGGNCTVAGLPATVDMNKCDYTFKQPTKIEGGKYTSEVDETCPKDETVEIHVYMSGSHLFEVCTIKTLASGEEEGGHDTRELKGHVVFTNIVTAGQKDHITLDGTVKGIRFSQSGLCGALEDEAEMKAKITMKAKDSQGAAHDFWISEEK